MFKDKFLRRGKVYRSGVAILGVIVICITMTTHAQAARAIVTKIALAYGATTPGGEKLSGTVEEALNDAGSGATQSFNYLDTTSSESFEPKDHTQSIVRTHRLDDGTARIFISQAENVNDTTSTWSSPFSSTSGDRGSIMGFKVGAGNTNSSTGMLTNGTGFFTNELFTRELSQSLNSKFAGFPDEVHPSSLAWLPDYSGPNSKGGYLFATFEYNGRSMRAYYWNRENPYVLEYLREFKFPEGSTRLPRFVSIIKNKGMYRLMIADSAHSDFYQAFPLELFNGGSRINFNAFRATNRVDIDNNAFPADRDTPDGYRRAFGQNAYFIQDKDENLFVVGYQHGNQSITGIDRAFVHPAAVDNATGNIDVGFVSSVHRFGVPSVLGSSVASYWAPNCDAGCSHWVNSSGQVEVSKTAHYSDLYGFDWKTVIESRRR